MFVCMFAHRACSGSQDKGKELLSWAQCTQGKSDHFPVRIDLNHEKQTKFKQNLSHPFSPGSTSPLSGAGDGEWGLLQVPYSSCLLLLSSHFSPTLPGFLSMDHKSFGKTLLLSGPFPRATGESSSLSSSLAKQKEKKYIERENTVLF